MRRAGGLAAEGDQIRPPHAFEEVDDEFHLAAAEGDVAAVLGAVGAVERGPALGALGCRIRRSAVGEHAAGHMRRP